MCHPPHTREWQEKGRREQRHINAEARLNPAASIPAELGLRRRRDCQHAFPSRKLEWNEIAEARILKNFLQRELRFAAPVWPLAGGAGDVLGAFLEPEVFEIY